MSKVTFAGRSDAGRVRPENQDRWAADSKHGLFLVSDGIGGAFAGELADRFCIGGHAAPERRDGRPSTLDIATDFARVHPEFAAVAHPDADRAVIAFNHQKHHLEDLGSKTGATTERPVPGRPRAKPVSETEWSWVNRQLAGAERVLFDAAGGCRYCHRVSEDRQANGLPKLAPTQILDRWLPRGQFSHGAHGTFTCTECHAATASSLTSDVLMPSIDSCRQCHTGARGLNGTASTRCVECHVYHRERETASGRLSLDLHLLNSPTLK